MSGGNTGDDIAAEAQRRAAALADLRRFGIRGPNVYLIDLIPLIEMIWADGEVQQAELGHLETFVRRHVERINAMANQQLLTYAAAYQFLSGYLEERPDPELMKTLRSFVQPVRLATSDPNYNDDTRRCLLSACVDIAASASIESPLETGESFDADEKRTYFEIIESL
jgi:hypothetical protein